MSVEIICSDCFRSCKSLDDVQFESNSQLRRIESGAFSECLSLTSILLPVSLKAIDGSAFSGSRVSKVIIPEESSSFQIQNDFVTDFEGTSLIMYFGQSSLLTIPSHYSRICGKCFFHCSWLLQIGFEIDSRLHRIESGAFWQCSSLKSILIPMSVEIICSDCFRSCKSLHDVQFESNSQLRRIESGAFSACSSLKSIFLPPSVEIISSDSFEGCFSLYMVTFSSS
jgi:hypothetical protein